MNPHAEMNVWVIHERNNNGMLLPHKGFFFFNIIRESGIWNMVS